MSTPAFRTILYTVADHVATITLNLPDRKNVIGVEMANELVVAVDEAAGDANVRAIVLTGAGSVFCAGGDLAGMPTGSDAHKPLAMRGDFGALLIRLAEIEKPTVARVQGPAMGGGLGLLASCHIAIACESATFATPEIMRGFFPFMISAVLERVMPRRKMMEMILLGEKMSAHEAREAGLLTRVVPDSELDAIVSNIARSLAELSPSAVRTGLSALQDNVDSSLRDSVPRLRDALIAALATEDAREGIAAFLEKRKPNWTGR